ncbi:TY-Chap domain-containing protein [Actinomadura roseirufa]|uniref:TY-Chap domain-containing protein n=1 Tax=Actinomadura roseirufa TaxID=2094049 RepID=UPI001041ACC3|nr:hypothetical protein [Actinomadura roseirufa]
MTERSATVEYGKPAAPGCESEPGLDWIDFGKRLTLELSRLPVKSSLVVQAADGPYVQAMRSAGVLHAEAAGSACLPRPLAPAQERRLRVLGWEPPEDERHNWWQRYTHRERGRRAPAQRLESCALLAGLMVGTLRDVYGAGSPLELVYRAGRSGGGATLLKLPGLGIPPAIPEPDAPSAAPMGGTRPAPAAPSVPSGAPDPADVRVAGSRPRRLAPPRAPARPSPPGTSPPVEAPSLGGRYAAPGPPQGGPGRSPRHARPSPPAQRPGGTGDSHGDPGRPEGRPAAPQPLARAAEAPGPAAGAGPPQDVIMQKVIQAGHVDDYLKGGYGLVAGFVHRLEDVRNLTTPAALLRALGLVSEGSPFTEADEQVFVVRWPAVKPPLFRRREDEMAETAPPSEVEEAPGEGVPVPEFRIESQRLPHGAELRRLAGDGGASLVAEYDADLRRWLVRLPGGRE